MLYIFKNSRLSFDFFLGFDTHADVEVALNVLFEEVREGQIISLKTMIEPFFDSQILYVFKRLILLSNHFPKK